MNYSISSTDALENAVDNNESKLLKSASVNHFLEPLSEFLKDDAITEICCNRPNEVFVEANSQWTQHNINFSYDDLLHLGIAVAKYTANEFIDTHPILSAVLPDGQRSQFVMPPACEDRTISLTIRKPSFMLRTLETYISDNFFSKIRPLSDELSFEEKELDELYRNKNYSQFIQKAVKYGKVIVVAGATGSGKTTFMKALMHEIPRSQRLITIEDVPELFLPHHPNHVHMFYPSEARDRDNAPITSSTLLKSCMRMKPDRILLAELRGQETYDFVNICASGHEGSITSCHAGSAALTFERLSLMMLQSDQGKSIPFNVIQQMLKSVIDVVVHIHNGHEGRHITEIWFDPRAKRATF